MADKAPWLVMVVDDDSEMCESVKEFINGEQLTDEGDVGVVTTVSNFSDALCLLAQSRYDVVVLDLRQGDYDLNPETEAGEELFQKIKSTRFLPIVFYTGLPMLVTHLENPPFIQVVAKGGTHEALLKAIRTTLISQLPSMNRALVSHVDKVQRDYMWEFVAEQWGRITAETDKISVAYLLARRLAGSLSDSSATQLAEDLGGQFDASIGSGKVHAMQYYVMPPIAEPSMMAGDIYKGKVGEHDGYSVMLTPSCDLVLGKADWLLLAICNPLEKEREYVKWAAQQSKTAIKGLQGVLGNNREAYQRDRHFYLPAAMNIPDLVVDLQNVAVARREHFESCAVERVATLDSPFAEALTSQFARLFGRIGAPDLDVDVLMARLKGGLGS